MATLTARQRALTVVASVAVAAAAAGAGIGLTTTSTSVASLATFPTPQSTGVPAGTVLKPYSGPNPIRTCGAVLDSVNVPGDLTILASNGTHSVSTPCVTINKSKVNGIIDDKWSSYSCAGFQGCGPVLVLDSEITGRNADVATISDSNYWVFRSYIHGSRSGAQCDGNCTMADNYMIADHEYGNAHMDAFISNGNYGAPMLLDHNTFLCQPTTSVPNGAGCAADVGLFGDFSAITNTQVSNNLFKANPSDIYYCFHTGYEPSKPYPNGGHITITGNVFERGSSGKCGSANPVYAWNNSAGTWCNNKFDNGDQVLPGNPDNCGSAPPTTVTTTTVKASTTIGSTPSSVPAPSTTVVTLPPATTSTTKPTTTTTAVPTFTCTQIVNRDTHNVIHANCS